MSNDEQKPPVDPVADDVTQEGNDIAAQTATGEGEDSAANEDAPPPETKETATGEGEDSAANEDAPQQESEAVIEDDTLPVPEEVLLSRIESLIFTSPAPMSVRKLARILSIEGKRVRELLGILTEHYQNRGIIVSEVSGGFQFRSHPDNAPVIRSVFKLKPLKISHPSLETLAIVAYRQPLTRAEVEQIRGVDCGGVLKFLFEKELVRVIGRKEEPGRPIIYGTTPKFLEPFGLKSLSDLPALHEFSELWDEHQEMVDEELPLNEPDEEPSFDQEEETEEAEDAEEEKETEEEENIQ